jgi:predicted YcjX-like family ATPase
MAVDYPVKWPLGLDVLKAQYKANTDQRLLAYQQPTIDTLGPNFMMKLLGNVGYTTMDPENVEAILSSKFAGMLLSRDSTHCMVIQV